MDKRLILMILLNSGETLIMPEAYDPISAKLIENTGFKAFNVRVIVFLLLQDIKEKLMFL